MHTPKLSTRAAPVITSARVTAMPKSLFGPLPQAIVHDSGGAITTLFEFYPDELSFTEDEFIELTIDQASTLKLSKDVAYLRS